MRILQVASALSREWGGIEKYLAYLSPELITLGHDVVISRAASSPLAAKCAVPGVDIHLRTRFDPLAAAKYLRFLRRERFDLVVTHFSPDYFVPAWAAKVTGVKTIMTRHVAVPLKPHRVRQYAKLYDGYTGVSKVVGRSLTTAGVEAERVTFAHVGFPGLTATHPSKTPNLTIDVGIFSRLVAEKGQEFAILAVTSPQVHLHIFGDGPDRNRLTKLAEGRNVTFHGFVENVPNAMMEMDLICMPSTWDEAFSIAILEAMSLGRPIVASNVGGIPEVIRHAETGWLVPAKDPLALTTAWIELGSNQDQAARLGANARALHKAQYTPEAGAKRIADAYGRLMGG